MKQLAISFLHPVDGWDVEQLPAVWGTHLVECCTESRGDFPFSMLLETERLFNLHWHWHYATNSKGHALRYGDFFFWWLLVRFNCALSWRVNAYISLPCPFRVPLSWARCVGLGVSLLFPFFLCVPRLLFRLGNLSFHCHFHCHFIHAGCVGVCVMRARVPSE